MKFSWFFSRSQPKPEEASRLQKRSSKLPQPPVEQPFIAMPSTHTEFFPSSAVSSRPSTPQWPRTPRASHTQSMASFDSVATRSPPISFRMPSYPRNYSRPASLFDAPSSPASSSSFSSRAAQSSLDIDCPLVLTLTSKYPVGMAADLYVPVNVSVPRKHSIIRQVSNKLRPPPGVRAPRVRPPSVCASVSSVHVDAIPRSANVLQRRPPMSRRESMSHANQFYY